MTPPHRHRAPALRLLIAAALLFTAAQAPVVDAQVQQMQTGTDLLGMCREPANSPNSQRCGAFLTEMFEMLGGVAPLCAPANGVLDLRTVYMRYTLAHPEYLAYGRSIAVTNAFMEAYPC